MQPILTKPEASMPDDSSDTLLDVRDLKTHFFTDEGVVKAVDGVNLSLKRGPDALRRWRIGLRQVGYRALDTAHRCRRRGGSSPVRSASGGGTARPDRPGADEPARARYSQHPRAGNQHDIPGAHVLA